MGLPDREEKSPDYQHLFGPAPSRRLGRSLGVDLVPYKTCSFDCVFCQLGKTTAKTVNREEYVPVEAVTAELEHWARTSGNSADYITLSGSGEPTLHARFGEVIAFARQVRDTRLALLTKKAIRNLLQRRPCTLDQIGAVFGLHKNEVSKYLGKLTRTGKVAVERRDGEVYYLRGSCETLSGRDGSPSRPRTFRRNVPTRDREQRGFARDS